MKKNSQNCSGCNLRNNLRLHKKKQNCRYLTQGLQTKGQISEMTEAINIKTNRI